MWFFVVVFFIFIDESVWRGISAIYLPQLTKMEGNQFWYSVFDFFPFVPLLRGLSGKRTNPIPESSIWNEFIPLVSLTLPGELFSQVEQILQRGFFFFLWVIYFSIASGVRIRNWKVCETIEPLQPNQIKPNQVSNILFLFNFCVFQNFMLNCFGFPNSLIAGTGVVFDFYHHRTNSMPENFYQCLFLPTPTYFIELVGQLW